MKQILKSYQNLRYQEKIKYINRLLDTNPMIALNIIHTKQFDIQSLDTDLLIFVINLNYLLKVSQNIVIQNNIQANTPQIVAIYIINNVLPNNIDLSILAKSLNFTNSNHHSVLEYIKKQILFPLSREVALILSKLNIQLDLQVLNDIYYNIQYNQDNIIKAALFSKYLVYNQNQSFRNYNFSKLYEYFTLDELESTISYVNFSLFSQKEVLQQINFLFQKFIISSRFVLKKMSYIFKFYAKSQLNDQIVLSDIVEVLIFFNVQITDQLQLRKYIQKVIQSLKTRPHTFILNILINKLNSSFKQFESQLFREQLINTLNISSDYLLIRAFDNVLQKKVSSQVIQHFNQIKVSSIEFEHFCIILQSEVYFVQYSDLYNKVLAFVFEIQDQKITNYDKLKNIILLLKAVAQNFIIPQTQICQLFQPLLYILSNQKMKYYINEIIPILIRSDNQLAQYLQLLCISQFTNELRDIRLTACGCCSCCKDICLDFDKILILSYLQPNKLIKQCILNVIRFSQSTSPEAIYIVKIGLQEVDYSIRKASIKASIHIVHIASYTTLIDITSLVFNNLTDKTLISTTKQLVKAITSRTSFNTILSEILEPGRFFCITRFRNIVWDLEVDIQLPFAGEMLL